MGVLQNTDESASAEPVAEHADRKIIHIDMDAFYASVEQRDDPSLIGLPVVVGGSPRGRGVVAAASYEARKFGIRSAMPARQALKLCPDTVFVKPRFDVYQSVSQQVQAIFREYTPLVEPLSLDEAYLDVTDCTLFDGSATRIAQAIRQQIRDTTHLIASAGVSYNKFLAKVASDIDKPDGFYRILPHEGEAFVARLPIGRFHGVGAVTEEKMHSLGIQHGADLKRWTLDELTYHFGKSARYYYQVARGIDNRRVSPTRTRKSIGSENTFSQNLSTRDEMLDALRKLSDGISASLRKRGLMATTLTIKLRYPDFNTVTRSHTLATPFDDMMHMEELIVLLLDRALEPGRSVRLLGVSASNLISANDGTPRQLMLFDQ